MKIIKPVAATVITEGIIALALWKLGVFPVLLLGISLSQKWGVITAGGMLLILTWALNFLFLCFFNRRKRGGKPRS